MHKRIVNLACILWAAKPHDTVVRQRGETIRLENASGFETINLNQRTAGLYLIEITDCYGNTNSVKVVKNQ
jgi:hypothetical protein